MAWSSSRTPHIVYRGVNQPSRAGPEPFQTGLGLRFHTSLAESRLNEDILREPTYLSFDENFSMEV